MGLRYRLKIKKKSYSVNPWRLVVVFEDGSEREMAGRDTKTGYWLPCSFRTKDDAVQFALDRYALFKSYAQAGIVCPYPLPLIESEYPGVDMKASSLG